MMSILDSRASVRGGGQHSGEAGRTLSQSPCRRLVAGPDLSVVHLVSQALTLAGGSTQA
jgi:hypothetical protein